MTAQDERIATIIRRRFHKSGSSVANTGLLNEISVYSREFIESSVVLEEDEVLLIASIQSATCWSALTTRRLIVSTDGILQIIPWERIEEVAVDVAGLEYSLDAPSKLSEVKVTTLDGAKVRVDTSPGQPLLGVWNCLILAKQMGEEEARRRRLSGE